MKNALLLLSGILISCLFGCKKSDSDSGSAREIKYELSNEIFPNPERGFMHLYDVPSEGEGLNLELLKTLRPDNVTLVHRMYYFEKFRDKALSEAELLLITTDMQKVREAGLKCILCFAYAGLGDIWNERKDEDAPYSTIEIHLDQLKPVFEANEDIIAFVQAGFIGPWGEWHSSTNGLETTYYKTKVLDKMLSVIPAEIMVQVRTPGYKQEIFGTTLPVDKTIAYSGDKRARVGHYNDCFMASADDYGTYTNIEAEKEYMSNEGLYVPAGGETCPPDPADYPTGCSTSRATMQLLRWTYLNLDWYQPTLNSWRDAGCFTEFQRDLGYRLALLDASFPDKIGSDKRMPFKIRLTNKGYAPLYNRKVTSLIFKDASSGELHQVDLRADLRECKPMGIMTIEDTSAVSEIPAGKYNLYLKIADRSESLKNRFEYSVRLANADVWTEENGGMNNLDCQVQIK